MAKQTPFFSSISRLYPHVKPIIPRLVMGLLCALLASVVALTIPQVLRVLINESLEPGGSTDAVWIAVPHHPAAWASPRPDSWRCAGSS